MRQAEPRAPWASRARIWSRVAAASLCLLALPPTMDVRAQEAERAADATIRGQVVDDVTGEPVPDVAVRIDGFSFAGATNADGFFTVDRIPLGTYALRLSHPAYHPTMGDLRVLRSGDFVTSMEPLDDESEYLVTGLVGVVSDATTGDPVRGAAVRVAGHAGGSARTDARGRFSIADVEAGWHAIQFSQLGFATRTDSVHVSPRRVTNVAVSLSVNPVVLPPLEVSVERREVALQDVGFYRRVREGFGDFIDREDIETRNPSEMSDLFTSLPGVEVFGDPDLPGLRYVVLRGGRQISFSDRNQRCFPRVVVDGLPVHRGGDEPMLLDRLVDPMQVAGVEVYPTSAGLPAQFSGIGSACGLILIWTRR